MSAQCEFLDNLYRWSSTALYKPQKQFADNGLLRIKQRWNYPEPQVQSVSSVTADSEIMNHDSAMLT